MGNWDCHECGQTVKMNGTMILCDHCANWFCLVCSDCKTLKRVREVEDITTPEGVVWFCRKCRNLIGKTVEEQLERNQLDLTEKECELVKLKEAVELAEERGRLVMRESEQKEALLREQIRERERKR